MKIQVLGTGCPTCKRLYERTVLAAQLVKISDTVEYITDVNKILELGIFQSPVLAINGKPILVGTVPEVKKIAQIFKEILD